MTDLIRPEQIPSVIARMDEHTHGGMAALAQLTDEEFEHRIQLMRKGIERTNRIHRELMTPEVDYGTVPGTQKPSLLQSGSEKLMIFYRLAPRFEITLTHGDGVSAPPINVLARCLLHVGNQEGPVIGEGAGTCSSWERKYRYRTGERACPECGTVGALTKSKKEGQGFFCWAKKGGCGAEFAVRDARITEQVAGMIDNPDPHDLENTLVKMAMKRAQVDATKRATGTSALYTQDVEDMEVGGTGQPTPESQNQQRPASGGKPASTTRPAAPSQAPTGDRCSECNAPAGRHGTKCSQYQRPASRPAPAPVSGDRNALLNRMFALYSQACEASGVESNDDLMRRHCAQVLRLVVGDPSIPVKSRKDLTDDELRICAEYFEHSGVPPMPAHEPTAEDDPFQDE